MRRRWRWLAAGLGLVTALAAGLVGLSGRTPTTPPGAARVSVAEALGGGGEAFERALAPRPLVFPADHGPHPGFRTEWWYFTGHLAAGATGSGPAFGFQLTFFRTALRRERAPRASAWGATEVYMAHLALTDPARGRFHATERFARAALGLAGARAAPFRVWLADWSAEAVDGEGPSLRLRAGSGEVAIDLVLDPGKRPVLHGDGGLSRKGSAAGHASHYYSLTRMPARGTVRAGGHAWTVRGLGWMDREWSTSALAADQVGWDWFGLQLDDGRELMLYRLRRRDGTTDAASSGTLVAGDGESRTLARDEATVEVLDEWTSPRSGTRYPARWRVRVEAAGLDLVLTPVLADQELDLAVRYWEGAVRVAGQARGRPVGGAGYVELVGYAGSAVRE